MCDISIWGARLGQSKSFKYLGRVVNDNETDADLLKVKFCKVGK